MRWKNPNFISFIITQSTVCPHFLVKLKRTHAEGVTHLDLSGILPHQIRSDKSKSVASFPETAKQRMLITELFWICLNTKSYPNYTISQFNTITFHLFICWYFNWSHWQNWFMLFDVAMCGSGQHWPNRINNYNQCVYVVHIKLTLEPWYFNVCC